MSSQAPALETRLNTYIDRQTPNPSIKRSTFRNTIRRASDFVNAKGNTTEDAKVKKSIIAQELKKFLLCPTEDSANSWNYTCHRIIEQETEWQAINGESDRRLINPESKKRSKKSSDDSLFELFEEVKNQASAKLEAQGYSKKVSELMVNLSLASSLLYKNESKNPYQRMFDYLKNNNKEGNKKYNPDEHKAIVRDVPDLSQLSDSKKRLITDSLHSLMNKEELNEIYGEFNAQVLSSARSNKAHNHINEEYETKNQLTLAESLFLKNRGVNFSNEDEIRKLNAMILKYKVSGNNYKEQVAKKLREHMIGKLPFHKVLRAKKGEELKGDLDKFYTTVKSQAMQHKPMELLMAFEEERAKLDHPYDNNEHFEKIEQLITTGGLYAIERIAKETGNGAEKRTELEWAIDGINDTLDNSDDQTIMEGFLNKLKEVPNQRKILNAKAKKNQATYMALIEEEKTKLNTATKESAKKAISAEITKYEKKLELTNKYLAYLESPSESPRPTKEDKSKAIETGLSLLTGETEKLASEVERYFDNLKIIPISDEALRAKLGHETTSADALADATQEDITTSEDESIASSIENDSNSTEKDQKMSPEELDAYNEITDEVEVNAVDRDSITTSQTSFFQPNPISEILSKLETFKKAYQIEELENPEDFEYKPSEYIDAALLAFKEGNLTEGKLQNLYEEVKSEREGKVNDLNGPPI